MLTCHRFDSGWCRVIFLFLLVGKYISMIVKKFQREAKMTRFTKGNGLPSLVFASFKAGVHLKPVFPPLNLV